jgi:hypothetical protein
MKLNILYLVSMIYIEELYCAVRVLKFDSKVFYFVYCVLLISCATLNYGSTLP